MTGRRFGMTWYMERSKDSVPVILLFRLRVIRFNSSIDAYPFPILKGSLHTPAVLNPP